MNRWRLIARGAVFHWRLHLGILLGCLLASAVLTGALLVGDSVDHTLTNIALQRLGDARFALDRGAGFFQEALAGAMGRETTAPVAAVLRLRGMALADDPGAGQVNRVQVLGVDDAFWKFAAGAQPAAGEAVVNEKLASALGLEPGDALSLRVENPDLLSRDAPLSSRTEDRTVRTRLTVMRVAPDDALGRFNLAAEQRAPYNVFVPREWLQSRVDLPGKANVLLVGDGPDPAAALARAWTPAHLGLRVRTVGGVPQLETDAVFFGPETARAAMAIPGAEGTLTYLVNTFSHGDQLTPYSFVVAGPAPPGMPEDGIVVNRWLADALSLAAGDTVTMRYAVLTPANRFEEHTRDFTVHAIREMEDLAEERARMPRFPGLSDVESCADWDVGMPMDEDLLKDEANEAYWDTYRETPKAFISLAAGQAMWGSRFGALSSVRYPGAAEADILPALRTAMDPAAAGLALRPVREEALQAVAKAIPFGGLFLGMSFFLIIAAFVFIGLLFVLGAQQRAGEMGILMALGFRLGQVRLLFLTEAGLIALVGSALGAVAGMAYTGALLWALARFWQGALANAAIDYHANTFTVLCGGMASFAGAVVTAAIATWRQLQHRPYTLLTADFRIAARPRAKAGWIGLALPLAGVVLALALAGAVVMAGAEHVVGPFFGVGALLLLALLGFVRAGLRRLDAGARGLSLAGLATRNLARRRARSLGVVALLASGCFLVFAVASMKEDVTANADQRTSGTGGFAIFAESTLGLLEPPTPDAVGIKVRDGDDASCLNLNRAQSPRLLGVDPERLAELGAFAPKDVWSLLDGAPVDGAVPALVGDSDTAMWGLQKKTDPVQGDTLAYLDGAGQPFKVKLVGKLPMRLSVFQGSVLISQQHFTRLFPGEEGHRMFLIDAAPEDVGSMIAALDRDHAREGLDAQPAVDRLREFYEVESTYLAMFLVLGALGMAVGTAGMGVVVLRNLVERRAEVGMLTAVGFGRRALGALLFWEHAALLLVGMAVGILSAGVAILPAMIASASSGNLLLQAVLALLIFISGAGCMGLAVWAGYPGRPFEALRRE